jgi:hypothetical protein
MKVLRGILLGVVLATGAVGATMVVAPPQARADYTLVIYGPYPTREAADTAAGPMFPNGWWVDYVTEPPPGVPGVTVVGFAGPGYYFWIY